MKDEYTLLSARIEEHTKIIKENNKMLKKLYRWSVINGVLRVVWYIIIIGLPFALYFYILEPYFNAFGSSYETFQSGMSELPGIKSINNLLGK